LDGFANKITMVAYANPERGPADKKGGDKEARAKAGPRDGWADGYGLIRFRKSSGEVVFECWPRFADVTQPGAAQFPGWPVTVKP
jgi:hypothetical protein